MKFALADRLFLMATVSCYITYIGGLMLFIRKFDVNIFISDCMQIDELITCRFSSSISISTVPSSFSIIRTI